MRSNPGEGHIPGPYVCPEDGRTYLHLRGLTAHARSQHPGLSQRGMALLRDKARLAAGRRLR